MVLLAPGGYKLTNNKQGITLAAMSSVDVISDVISWCHQLMTSTDVDIASQLTNNKQGTTLAVMSSVVTVTYHTMDH